MQPWLSSGTTAPKLSHTATRKPLWTPPRDSTLRCAPQSPGDSPGTRCRRRVHLSVFQICQRALPAGSASSDTWPSLLPPGGTQLSAARQDRRRQTVSPASPGAGRSRVTTTQWSCTLASASTSTAPPRSCRSLENFAPGQLHSTPLGRGPGRGGDPYYLPQPARTGRGPAPADSGESSRITASRVAREAAESGDHEVRPWVGWGLESPVLGGREGWGSPLSPPRGRSRGPSLRYLRLGETGVGLPARLPPSTARPRTVEDPTPLPVSTTGQTQPPGSPAWPTGPGAGASAAPASFSHPGSSCRAAMARGDAPRDRQVGDHVGCGVLGSCGRGQRRAAPLGLSKAQRPVGTTIPVSPPPPVPEPG